MSRLLELTDVGTRKIGRRRAIGNAFRWTIAASFGTVAWLAQGGQARASCSGNPFSPCNPTNCPAGTMIVACCCLEHTNTCSSGTCNDPNYYCWYCVDCNNHEWECLECNSDNPQCSGAIYLGLSPQP